MPRLSTGVKSVVLLALFCGCPVGSGDHDVQNQDRGALSTKLYDEGELDRTAPIAWVSVHQGDIDTCTDVECARDTVPVTVDDVLRPGPVAHFLRMEGQDSNGVAAVVNMLADGGSISLLMAPLQGVAPLQSGAPAYACTTTGHGADGLDFSLSLRFPDASGIDSLISMACVLGGLGRFNGRDASSVDIDGLTLAENLKRETVCRRTIEEALAEIDASNRRIQH